MLRGLRGSEINIEIVFGVESGGREEEVEFEERVVVALASEVTSETCCD